MSNNLFAISPQGFNALFNYLANDPNIVTWIAAPDFSRQIYLSNSFEKIFGWPQQAMYEDITLWRSFLFQDDKEAAIRNLFIPNNSLEQEKILHYRCYAPDQKIVCIRDHHFPLYDKEEKLIAYAGYCYKLPDNEWLKASAKHILEKRDACNFYKLLTKEFNLQESCSTFTKPLSYTVLTKKQTAELTLREAQTLYYLLSGYSSKMIAKNLDISTRTVEIHIANIRKKTATHSRLDLLSQIINADEIASWLPNKK